MENKIVNFFPEIVGALWLQNLITKAIGLQKHKQRPEIKTNCYFWILPTDVFSTKNSVMGIF